VGFELGRLTFWPGCFLTSSPPPLVHFPPRVRCVYPPCSRPLFSFSEALLRRLPFFFLSPTIDLLPFWTRRPFQHLCWAPFFLAPPFTLQCLPSFPSLQLTLSQCSARGSVYRLFCVRFPNTEGTLNSVTSYELCFLARRTFRTAW